MPLDCFSRLIARPQVVMQETLARLVERFPLMLSASASNSHTIFLSLNQNATQIPFQVGLHIFFSNPPSPSGESNPP